MYALASDHTIHYRIAKQPAGIRLTLWELARNAEGRQKPYLYLINYTFHDIEEAQNVLKQHLVLNGVSGVIDTNLPAAGKVRIMPYPTWSNCEIVPQNSSSA
jgi:hypothetical protein